MKPLLILTDNDLFENVKDLDIPLKDRVAVRVILLDDDGKVALVGAVAHILPGGGVEQEETLEDAVHRESMEEVGCKIGKLSYLGFTEDTRSKRGIKQTTHCFVAKVMGEKGIPTTTQEDEQNMMLDWLIPEDALKSLQKGEDEYSGKRYHFSFNVRAHIVFLEKYLEKVT